MKIAPFKIDEFIKNIDQNPDISAVLIYGPEAGLATIRFREIAHKISPDINDPFLVSNISIKQIEENKNLLFDEFFSISMIPGRKLIKIDAANNKITANLKSLFESEAKSDNFLLINAGDLDKSSSLRNFAEKHPKIATIACYEDNLATISKVIRDKFVENNIKMENDVMPFITNKLGKNRLVILNEIDKIITYLDGEKLLTLKIAEDLLSDISESNILEFVNNFVALNLQKSMFILDQIYYQKTSPIVIIRYLQNYFLKLLKSVSNIQNGSNVESQIKEQRIFFKDAAFFKQHCQIWQIKSIEDLLQKLQELEVKCKRDYDNIQNLFNAFINFTYLLKKSGKI